VEEWWSLRESGWDTGAAVLAFVVHPRGKGLLIGLTTRSCVQGSNSACSLETNWQE